MTCFVDEFQAYGGAFLARLMHNVTEGSCMTLPGEPAGGFPGIMEWQGIHTW